MKRILLWSALLMLSFSQSNIQAQCQVSGWASQNGVTGGGSATPTVVTTYNELKTAITTPTVVTTYNELKTAINATAVKVIHISGQITFPAAGRLTLNNQTGKSILGLAGAKLTSVDLTSGGSGVLYVKNSSNILIKNITFEGPGAYDVDGNDNLTLDNATSVWVDHCTFQDALDGNLDIKNASDLITVTWTKFQYLKAPIPGGSGGSNDHRFSNLFGSGDDATQDEGKLRITMQYCWWGPGVRERMPRVRFGKVHLLNNYFNSSVSNYCIYAGFKADLLIEGNYFENVKNPIRLETGSFTAAQLVNNTFSGATGTMTGSGTAFTPPYSINKIASQDVKQTVTAGAGAVLLQPTDCVFLATNEANFKNSSKSSLYPNPTSGNISLKVFAKENNPVQITVNDISGKYEGVVYTGTLKRGDNTVDAISIKNISKGIKLFTVQTADETFVQKVIVN